MRADGDKFLHYVFCRDRALFALRFITRMCRLSEGRFAGQRIKLLPFQVELISELFGWIDPATGFRRYRKAFWFLPRKNGKSTLIAGIALYMLMADGEFGAQVILASNSKDQSGVVFKPAAEMVKQSPQLLAECDVRKANRRILHPSTSSYLAVVPADGKNTLGLNVSCLVYDEIAAAPNRDLYDALTTSSGTRQQALQLFITTAGKETESIGYELYTYAKNVLADPASDPTFYPVIFELSKEDDWTEEANWFKCNPALGSFKLLPDMQAEFTEAMTSTSAQNKFKLFSLNQWVQAVDSWIDIDQWKLCGDPNFDESILKDCPCFLGMDLSKVTDLTALVALWRLPDGRLYLKPRFFIPAEGLRDRCVKDHVPYDAWVENNWVTTTPGPVVDYSFVQAALEEFKKNNQIKAVGYDSWGAVQLVADLTKAGFPMILMRQGHQTLATPSNEFETLVIAKRLVQNANPCMQWQIGNVVTRMDAGANIIPDKKNSTHRIDGVQATIMALGCAMRMAEAPKPVQELRVHSWG